MNKFLIILNIYLILEGIHYVSHLIQYEKILKVKKHKKNKKDKKRAKHCGKVIKEDFINHIKDPHLIINNVFNGRIRTLSKTNVYELLTKTFYSPYHKKINKSNHIFDIIRKYEMGANIKLSETSKDIVDINSPIKVWYKPLPIILAFEAILLYSDMAMMTEGFNKTIYDNGLVIWSRIGNKNKTNIITFLHAIAGGLVAQMAFIKKLPKTHTIVIPEIPGIAFGNRVFIPPTIRKISELIIDFTINMSPEYFQLISHSFGGNIVSCIINNYINKLEKHNIKLINTTLVEPIIFLPSLFPVYNLLNTELGTNDIIHYMKTNKARMLSYVLIFRDIYVQYYSKCLTMTDVLMGTTEYEKKNYITVILAEKDELYSAYECEHYLKSKKYNCDIIMLKDTYHGDFCFDEKMHKIVLNLIK